MTRTTLDIDASILRELKGRQRAEGKTLGELASELLADALARGQADEQRPLQWATRPMGARVDLEDREAVRRALNDQ